MHAGHDVPDIFLARIVSAGGPYRVNDVIAIACSASNVGRLVALEAAVRGRCAQHEQTAIPDSVSAMVEHARAPYASGETLTLYFVDPAIARIRRDALAPLPAGDFVTEVGVTQAFAETSSYQPQDVRRSKAKHEGDATTLRVDDRTAAEPLANERVATISAADSRVSTERAAIESIEPMARVFSPSLPVAAPQAPTTAPAPGAESGIVVRLEWSAERVRRFIQVVDRLFTIDRLGWYRHSLAMRLLVPDEIRCGDELADVEAMRHLHALRSAAVTALGKPLLAACMPGFAVTSEWLETLESSREARAIAGLRDALLPCATDRPEDENEPVRTVDAAWTVGVLNERALLAESATSVESFLPLLIATQGYDATLSLRLIDYRDSLVELFAQTARATDSVRLGALTLPNHSLDDRLWLLVGAVGEAFGGFART